MSQSDNLTSTPYELYPLICVNVREKRYDERNTNDDDSRFYSFILWNVNIRGLFNATTILSRIRTHLLREISHSAEAVDYTYRTSAKG